MEHTENGMYKKFTYHNINRCNLCNSSKWRFMKIIICGSMKFAKKMVEVKEELEKMGHVVHTPPGTEKYAFGMKAEEVHSESVKNKVEKDLIRKYFDWIGERDAVLVINIDKGDIKNYIGGNAFIEMAFAHVLHKPIYLLNPIPDMGYTDEIVAMKPIIINGDLGKIV